MSGGRGVSVEEDKTFFYERYTLARIIKWMFHLSYNLVVWLKISCFLWESKVHEFWHEDEEKFNFSRFVFSTWQFELEFDFTLQQLLISMTFLCKKVSAFQSLEF